MKNNNKISEIKLQNIKELKISELVELNLTEPEEMKLKISKAINEKMKIDK
ncbi:hypothetical protein [Leptotrichia hongkongensis]|uniref:hypothetical protein n=1 Tax=Leptotrichia hongkongensis TaxID=554406 RepID=UPI0035A8A9A3